MTTFTCPIGCGLAGVSGFEIVGGVNGGANRNPGSRGLCGPLRLPRNELPTEPGPPFGSSIANGEGGLSSSYCDRLRNTAVSSTYFERNPFKP